MPLSKDAEREKYRTDPAFRKRKLAATRAWRKRNRSYFRKWDKNYRARNTQLLNELKNKPCADCGKSYPPYVMDFDHINGTKKDAVSRISGKGHGTRQALLAEVAKCEVVCSNCHRIRSHNRLSSSCPPTPKI